MIDTAELVKLTNYIEENLRASQNAGMDFIDPKQYRSRMHAKQNHVAYGRRGSGKSSLLSCLNDTDDHFNAYINIEDFKDISFPNILLHVLSSLLQQILAESERKFPWYRFNLPAIKSRREIAKKITELKLLINLPDTQEIEHRKKDSTEGNIDSKIKNRIAEIGGNIKSGAEVEEKKIITNDKLEGIRLSLSEHKEILKRVSESHNNISIFLCIDDLYFLNKNIQPIFVDFFHRVSKGINLNIKIATIKHRSILYIQKDGTYTGMESGHDIHDIDMDYSLDKFEELKGFMTSLLDHAKDKSKANINISNFFSGEAFSQLCLASGGVPRDFLSLFLKLSETKLMYGNKIGKVDVTEVAINNISKKLDAIGRDSGSESDTLENYLHSIKSHVYTEKRTNAFLVAKEDLELKKQARQAIRELADMRLLHLIDKNTSCAPSDGRRYEAYILDVGLYDNSRPRNFTQLEPGATDDKSRRDRMRASPRLDLEQLENNVKTSNLTITVITPEAIV